MRRLIVFAAVLSCVVAAGFAAYLVYGMPKNGVDDAQIFIVYAENLSHGGGFSYNVGGERVEGFSSLLWTLVCALALQLYRIPEAPLLAFSVVLGGLSLWLLAIPVELALHLERSPRPRRQRYCAVALFLFAVLGSGAWSVWQILSLMDTGLWGLLVAAASASLLCGWGHSGARGPISTLAACGVLMVLARPEALLLAPVWAVLESWAGWYESWSWRSALRRAGWLLGPIAIAIVLITLFRLSYFGYPFPNTYYAKLSNSTIENLRDGTRYFVRYLRASPLALVSLSLVLTGVLRCAWVAISVRRPSWTVPPRWIGRQWLSAAMFSLVLVLVPVSAGGDHFLLFRMFQPGLAPLVATALVWALGASHSMAVANRGMRSRIRWLPLYLLIAGVGLEIILGSTGWRSISAETPAKWEFEISSDGLSQGAIVKRVFGGLRMLPMVGVVSAGGFKRGYGGPVLDFFGLNHVGMAHSPNKIAGWKSHASFDLDIFFKELPELILPTAGYLVEPAGPLPEDPAARWSIWDVPLRGLLKSQRFEALYVYARVSDPDATREYVEAYFRRDFAKALQAGSELRLEVKNGN